ncbi:Rrf2 family transcriptional regulator [Deinococcus yunweiensis]|uniref:Rrf2 family transcriptional regulator n=1 Tax=Deinococcus yunweiensis TaxID=367282 RepID=UPI00398EC40C
MSDAVEWALHATTTLALLPADAALPARALAQYLGVSESYLLKNLKLLAQTGILRSLSGPKGGYQLGRAPGDITLLEVVQAIEGTAPVFTCANVRENVPFPCPPGSFRDACAIRAAMATAQRAYEDALRIQTIAHMTAALSRGLSDDLRREGEAWFRANVRFSPS